MSQLGQKRKSALVTAMSAFPPDSDQTADIAGGPFRAITRSQFIDPFVGAFFIDKTSRLYE
jgi:hypothetical protein